MNQDEINHMFLAISDGSTIDGNSGSQTKADHFFFVAKCDFFRRYGQTHGSMDFATWHLYSG